ncbi:MAG TPA: phosphoethanolamine transferase domain-containing protein [Chitinophagales bacterium]|nr:phosphoethanolamine transferase domain-containing protein [Chitinophagales bacterium]
MKNGRYSNVVILVAIIAIQLVLLNMAFKDTLAEKGNLIFCNDYDGLKNYYTLHTYVTDTATKDLRHYAFMNYPYGDCVFYTDNTPLFSMGYKALVLKWPQLAVYDFQVFHLVLILNILLASVLLYFILARWVSNPILLIAFAVGLPWVSQMFLKLTNCVNLSLTSLIVLHLLLHVKLFESSDNKRKYYPIAAALVMLLLGAFLIHGYYLFIMAFTSGYLLLFEAIVKLRLRPLIAAATIPGLGFGLSMAALRLIDTQLSMRSTNIFGYGYDDWEASFLAYFTPYPQNSIRFGVAPNDYPFSFEAAAYMGSAFLIGAGLLVLLWLIKCVAKKRLARGFITSYNRLPIILLLTAFFMAAMSFGTDGSFFKSKHQYHNILNPIYYIQNIIPEFKHIRYTTRYNFPVFFIANILLAGALQQYINRTSFQWVKTLLPVIVAIPLASDTRDAVTTFYTKRNLLYSKYFKESVNIPAINYTSYQAILPLPYYHVGSADWAHTMETGEDYFNRMLAVSSNVHLPLMSCKMSRTPDYQNQNMVNMLLYDSISTDIMNRLNDKPILIILDKTYQPADGLAEHTVAYEAARQHTAFIKRHHTELVAEDNQYAYYRWYPKKHKLQSN